MTSPCLTDNDDDIGGIAREALEQVTGASLITRTADVLGPIAGKYYGEDWDTASCYSRANLVGGAVRNLTVLGTGAVGLAVGALTRSPKIGVAAAFASDLALDWTRTKVQSHYLSEVCNKK